MKKKIALYSHSIAPSIDGVSRRFTDIIWELDRQGYELLLFTLEDNPQDLPPFVAHVTINHTTFPAYPGKKVAKPSIRTFVKIVNNLKKFQCDVVHITADMHSQLFSLAGMVLGIPILGSFHTDLQLLFKANNANLFQRGYINLKERVDSSFLFDSAATTSRSFAEKLRRQGVRTEHVMVTSVDSATFTKDKFSQRLRDKMTFGDRNGMLCVLVGRISAEKRIDVMVEAIRSIDGVYLAIVGDGPMAGVYSKLHGKANRVYCKPAFLTHNELAKVYASSDVHVSASDFETLGNTVLEAFACAVPVVAPRAQGFLDTVTHGSNGFLFNTGDSSSAGMYITELKTNPKLREEMGLRGRYSVESRSTGMVVKKLVKWYLLGISNRKAKPFGQTLLQLLICVITLPVSLLVLAIYDFLLLLLRLAHTAPEHDRQPAYALASTSDAVSSENKKDYYILSDFLANFIDFSWSLIFEYIVDY